MELHQVLAAAGCSEEFIPALKHFIDVVKALESQDMAMMEHGKVEEWLGKSGNETNRLLLQAYFDQCAVKEPPFDGVSGADGVIRDHREDGCERNLMTLFGRTVVTRQCYDKYGGKKLYPLDGALNLPQDLYSLGLRRRVAEGAKLNSFDEVTANVQRTTGGKVPKRQAEELVEKAAQDFQAFYDGRRAQAAEATSDPLIMSLDGKGIRMRPASLRECTRKAAERDEHKMRTRLSPGEKGNRKRMSTVATIYSIEPHVRSAEEIMKRGKDRVGEVTPHAQNKRVWASLACDHLTVTDEVFQEALRRDPERRRAWAMLVDGLEQQISNIEKCMKKYGAQDVILILDWIHVLEYVWKAAYGFFPNGGEAAEKWVAQRALAILKGKASNVAAGMRRSATLRKLSKAARKPVDTCADYLLKYSYMLRYDKFLAMGLPIATGVIEGACRHLVKDRLDITGARWGLAGAEAVLRLRSLHSSHDLDEYWDFHIAQELQRNHLVRYEHFPFQRV